MKTHATAFAALALTALLFASPAMAEDNMMKKDKMDHKECMTMVKTGNADVDFIRNMIPHHKMALEMAENELRDGKDAEAKSMAQKIIDGQKKEIAEMEDWLKSHH